MAEIEPRITHAFFTHFEPQRRRPAAVAAAGKQGDERDHEANGVASSRGSARASE